MKKITVAISFAVAGLVSTPVFATLFPSTPRVSVDVLAGNGWTITSDTLVPLAGSPDSFFFIAPSLYYYESDGSYTTSLGIGQRWFSEKAGVMSAYVFADNNHSQEGNNFWFVSPGFQRLGDVLDFSANVYIPVTSQYISTGTQFADQVGDSSQVTFSGHDQFDNLVNTFESTGWGTDAEIGVRLPVKNNSEIYFGGYYFTQKDQDNIAGGSVRAEIPMNRFVSFLLSESYDTVWHNTLKAGLSVSLGGKNLTERMRDSLHRNLVAVSGGAHTAQPISSGQKDTGQVALEQSNISFFVSGADAGADNTQTGDGTYENPYVNMTQDNVDDANAQNNRVFYLNSGTYNAVYGQDNSFILLNNDQVYGRTDDFKRQAFGSDRPWLIFSEGGFEVPGGDTQDTLSSLKITGENETHTAGIFINHTSGPSINVVMDNLQVQNFGDGIDVWNNSASDVTARISHSLITQNNDEGMMGATGGIAAQNAYPSTGNLNLSVQHSTISDNSKPDSTVKGSVGGIAVMNQAPQGELNLTVSSSKVTQNTINMLSDAGGGIAALNDGKAMTLNISHSEISNNTIYNATDAGGGIAIAVYDGQLTAHITHSVISQNQIMATTLYSSVGGIAASNFGYSGATDLSVNIDHTSVLNNMASGGAAAAGGIAIYDYNFHNYSVSSAITIENSTISGNEGAGYLSSGGIAIVNDASGAQEVSATLNIKNSAVTDNIGYGGDSAGGLAVGNYAQNAESLASTTLNISHSDFSNNTGSARFSVGGIALTNIGYFGTATLTLNADALNFDNNNGLSEVAAGDIAAVNMAIAPRSSAQTNIHVSDSNITNEGIAAQNLPSLGDASITINNGR